MDSLNVINELAPKRRGEIEETAHRLTTQPRPFSVPVKRLRLCVNHKDRALVLAQGASKHSYKPFAQAFGGSANRRAALIVESVNSHAHMLKTLRAVQRMSQLPVSDSDRQRTRLALIARYVTTALAQVEK